jgi:hypothetical protein
MEKEKQNYDFENIQSQLDKALGQATRLQKERETVQLEADRLRDKYEKVQVGLFHTVYLRHITLLNKFEHGTNDSEFGQKQKVQNLLIIR